MSEHPVKRRKKLIEVGIPLEAINEAAIREGFIYRGNPSALHKWWAQRPLAVARAIIFSQLVDDPGEVPEKFETEHDVEIERLKLFKLLSEMVQWENLHNNEILEDAYSHIRESWERTCDDNREHPLRDTLFNPLQVPAFHDPFSGSGALPLEAQRLGLRATSADINPVAILLSRSAIDYAARFRDTESIAPQKNLIEERGPHCGLSNDVIHYGALLYSKASTAIRFSYPLAYPSDADIKVSPFLATYKDSGIDPIGWIWARTVKSPNPAYSDVDVPLASTFMLCTKSQHEIAVASSIDKDGYRLSICRPKQGQIGELKRGTKATRGANFRCIITGDPITPEYVKRYASENGFGYKLLAVAVDTDRGRTYLSPDSKTESDALKPHAGWDPRIEINGSTQYLGVKPYGINRFDQLFMPRQLRALDCLTALLPEIQAAAFSDAVKSWGCCDTKDDIRPLSEGGNGPKAYAEAIVVYLAMAIDKMAEYNCSLVPWNSKENRPKSLFVRHAIPIVWDFVELNPLGQVGGSLLASVKVVAGAIKGCSRRGSSGSTWQMDATISTLSKEKIVSTDPPYYNNVPYADLSDFFYVWLRKSLKQIAPAEFATLASPKREELVAFSYRHNEDKKIADKYFLDGMTEALTRIRELSHPAYPVTIYYAFKQTETDASGTTSTGWESFLDSIIKSGLEISGTWPLRTERKGRSVGNGANALASSIVLVCNKKSRSGSSIDKQEFRRQLHTRLSAAIRVAESQGVTPVDMLQSLIGPGMSVYTSYDKVTSASDELITVRDALREISKTLDDILESSDGGTDPITRFALAFYCNYSYSSRDYGDAEALAQALNISVKSVSEYGIIKALKGTARLLKRDELDAYWSPEDDRKICTWEALQHLIKRLEDGGEEASAALMSRIRLLDNGGELIDGCLSLAYRLYNHCDKAKQSEEARAYNGLVVAWPELDRLASIKSTETTVQASLI